MLETLFQFTPLREGRPRRTWDKTISRTISIHAPPRGATRAQFGDERQYYYFNSRPSARGDRASRSSELKPLYFNSRPSARGDFAQNVGQNYIADNFNSRPSARGDEIIYGMRQNVFISIHAPPRGATR